MLDGACRLQCFDSHTHWWVRVGRKTMGQWANELSEGDIRRGFYPRDAMLARVIVIATCLSVRLSVRLSRAGIVSKRRKLAA